MGISAFALGVMYRLAPHGWFMITFSVDGDLDKSIKFHKQTLKASQLKLNTVQSLEQAICCKWQLKKDKEALRLLGFLPM